MRVVSGNCYQRFLFKEILQLTDFQKYNYKFLTMSIRQAVTPFVIQCGASIHIMHSSKGEINLITKEREKKFTFIYQSLCFDDRLIHGYAIINSLNRPIRVVSMINSSSYIDIKDTLTVLRSSFQNISKKFTATLGNLTLSPSTDQSLISANSIISESNIKIMRMKEMMGN